MTDMEWQTIGRNIAPPASNETPVPMVANLPY